MPLEYGGHGVEVKKFGGLAEASNGDSRKIKVLTMTRRSAHHHYPYNGGGSPSNKASPASTTLYGTAPPPILRHRSPVVLEALSRTVENMGPGDYLKSPAAALRLLQQYSPLGIAGDLVTDVVDRVDDDREKSLPNDEDKENETLYETDGNILIMSAPALQNDAPQKVVQVGDTKAHDDHPTRQQQYPLAPKSPPKRGSGASDITADDKAGKGAIAEANQCESVLDKVTYLLNLHPKYFDTFYGAHTFMLKGNGPLKISDRNYVAMIAASRFNCTYLVEYQKREFLAHGGNPLYLQSIEFVPQKLRDLQDINKILAHQPWLITKSHIEKLTKGSNNWSLSELIFAIAIMSHFHSLCSLVYGCAWLYGFQEPEQPQVTEPDESSQANDLPEYVVESVPEQKKDSRANGQHVSLPNHDKGGRDGTEGTTDGANDVLEGTVDALVVKMKKLHQQMKQDLETTHEEMLERYQNVVELSTLEYDPTKREIHGPVKAPCGIKKALLVEDPSFAYEDFAKRDSPNRASTFRIQDYTWEHHGFSLVSRLCSDLGPLLDDKFKTAYNLTYLTMGKVRGIDTSMFRRAIWNYIHCMFGIRHDDYDYSLVNQLLEREFKCFIKLITCYPERIYSLDNQNFMKDFKESEKVHVNIMCTEAKIQAQMLYALRAIMQYMT